MEIFSLLLPVILWLCHCVQALSSSHSVAIFHLIDQKNWGETDGSILQGKFICPPHYDEIVKSCEIISTNKDSTGMELIQDLSKKYHAYIKDSSNAVAGATTTTTTTADVTLGLYSIHSWNTSPYPHYPNKCLLPTMLNMAESEESSQRFHKLFTSSFPGYDGNSTTHPDSSVQRTYISSQSSSSSSSTTVPLVSYGDKLRAAAYVVSTCHGRGHKAPVREKVVNKLEELYRIDSLGKCHRTKSTTGNTGAPVLGTGQTDAETLILKQQALSKYLFYLAFENTIESGYTTEKVFDAFHAGTVPVYLGDSKGCRKLIPHEKAVIFVDDYDSIEDLGVYLTYLSNNQTAYNEHLQWRKANAAATVSTSTTDSSNDLISVSWPCRVCKWAARQFAAGAVITQIADAEAEAGATGIGDGKEDC